MQKIENRIEDVPILENDPENSPERTELEVWEYFEAATEDEMFLHVSTVANSHFKWFKRILVFLCGAISKVKFGMNTRKLKRCVFQCSSSKNCQFRVSLNFDLKKMKYFFKVSELNHPYHEVEALGEIKKIIQQLTAEELKFIKTLEIAETNTSSAMIALHRSFSGVLFPKGLIRREMNKDKENNYNSEDTNLVKLMNCGNKCILRGGSFNLHFNHGSILTGVTFQEALQLKLAGLYGDSIQIDTTHGLTRYRLVAIFPVVVDSFLKIIIFGCVMMKNENSNDVKRGLQKLNLNKAEVMMSDGSPALVKVVKSCGAKHIRCLKHFAATFSEAAKGLKGSNLVEFRKELAEIITGFFPNLRGLDNSFKEMMEKFTEPAQQKYLTHFVRVYDKRREEFINPGNLLPRWRYKEHPLYQVSFKELERVKTSETKLIEFKVKVADLETKAVPKSGEAKYSRLLAECTLLAEEAKHSDGGYRKLFATVRKMRRTLRNNTDGNFAQLQRVSDDTVVTFESPRKRQRKTRTTQVVSPSRLDFSSLSQ
eukprot:augustus_masked-scaffold_2-processed-gene-22.40-mRNA-1 protein AED:1.00 eAED:1.00 QI:0/0/0/0/1/1/2/0/538